jgi:hypothetical protein
VICLIQHREFYKETLNLDNHLPVGNERRLKDLHLLLDNSKLLRVGGRPGNADISLEQMPPFICPPPPKMLRAGLQALLTAILSRAPVVKATIKCFL